MNVNIVIPKIGAHYLAPKNKMHIFVENGLRLNCTDLWRPYPSINVHR
jgi:hypothetical protein